MLPSLPNTYGLCYGRLKSVLSLLKNKSNLLSKYNDIIEKQKSLKIIESVLNKHSQYPVYYIPHQQIYRKDKDKLRIECVRHQCQTFINRFTQ